jgi:hypothetical protein
MNPKKTILRIFIILTFALSFFPIYTTLALPFDPTPSPPYQGVYWGVSKGDIFRWNTTGYNGSTVILSTDTSLRINTTSVITNYDDIEYYALQVQPMIYNETEDVFQEDPLCSNLQNISLVNFTLSKMMAGPGGQPLTLFIPKLGTSLMTEWCANASYLQYKGLFDPAYPPRVSFTQNSIRYYNNTSGDFTELIYCNDGSLKSCYQYLTYKAMFGFDELIINVTRLYPACQEVSSEPPLMPSISFGNGSLIFFLIGVISVILSGLKNKNN